MANFFQFETDFVDSLRCIPMEVRMKLDTCGVKLKLVHWHQFSQEERQALVNLPCRNSTESQAYGEFLQNLVVQKTGTLPRNLLLTLIPLGWITRSFLPIFRLKRQSLALQLPEGNGKISLLCSVLL